MKITHPAASNVSNIASSSQPSDKTDAQKSNVSQKIKKVSNSAVSTKINFRKKQKQYKEFNSAAPQPGQEAKNFRYQQFPGSYVLMTGKEHHDSFNKGVHIADINTSKTMQKLIAEGYELQTLNKPAANIAEITQLTEVFSTAADGKLSELTQNVALQVSVQKDLQTNTRVVSQQTASNVSANEWLLENDKPGNFLILNGNNDETYVSLIGEMAKNSKHLQFIASGFGGHGTTDRRSISVNKTEGDRFKQILVGQGVEPDRISVDPWSTNSGQNAVNVATILNEKIIAGEPCNKIIIAGTPAAVFRQTYTYAKQLDVPSLSNFKIDSFPFAKAQEYSTAADNLAILRELSTTINYLLNTDYLPANPDLYPESFFTSAIDSFHKTADGLEKESPQQYEDVIMAMRALSQESVTRIRDSKASNEDKSNIKIVDNFYRNLFNPLELAFKRTTL